MTASQTNVNFIKRLSHLWRRIRPFFQRLHWKLTFAYTLSTVITTLILGVAGVTLLWYLNFRSSFVPNLIGEGLTKVTPSLTPYLDRTPPDRAGLKRWLDEVITGDNLVIYIPRDEPKEDDDVVPAQFGRVVTVAIVDAQGRTVAAFPEEIVKSRPDFQAQLSADVADGFQAALAGETEPAAISTRDREGYLVATAPIFDAGDQVIGAIFVKSAFPIEAKEFLQNTLQRLVLPLALAMLVMGAVAGVLFGYFISRNLTRRLKTLDTAATAWSQGNFDVFAPDLSGDELGHVARHFNYMAIQLQNLFQTRQGLATLEERNRLARDLHDSVKQQVFATMMQVGAAKALIDHDPVGAKIHLLEAEQLVRQAQQELTGLINELRPAALEGKGLVGALKDYTAGWSRRNNITAEVRVRGERPLPLQVEHTFFRIAQEALSNIARHSRATMAEVDLVWRNKGLILTISDNGTGFDVRHANGAGVGLQSMRERIEALGGCLVVESQIGKGAWVTAELMNIS